ncbi:GtrA domain-containing protein [Plantibacter sp. RU18]|uniref:GtrA family protein n=1 Tax=Plantibacter sp. TaxID=1871045 RepID=UPI0032618529
MMDRSVLRQPVVRELAAFAAIGGAGFLVDVGVFNILVFTVFAHAGTSGILLAKGISTTLAIVANWVGNRLITFRRHRRPDVLREALEFGLVSVAGGAIALLCLWISHDAMHLTTPLEDNLSGNVVGLSLGSAFRYALYRVWVFGPRGGDRRTSRSVADRPGRVPDGPDLADQLP